MPRQASRCRRPVAVAGPVVRGGGIVRPALRMSGTLVSGNHSAELAVCGVARYCGGMSTKLQGWRKYEMLEVVASRPELRRVSAARLAAG